MPDQRSLTEMLADAERALELAETLNRRLRPCENACYKSPESIYKCYFREANEHLAASRTLVPQMAADVKTLVERLKHAEDALTQEATRMSGRGLAERTYFKWVKSNAD